MSHSIQIQHPIFDSTEKVIYKYPIDAGGVTILTGYFYEILDVQEQNGTIMLWASIGPYVRDCNGNIRAREDPGTTIRITALGTGWNYNKREVGEYFRTVQASDGLVWHIFVKKEENNGKSI